MADYLGPRVRLDDLYVKSVMDGLNATAEGWHGLGIGPAMLAAVEKR